LQAHVSGGAPDTIGHQPAHATRYSGRIVIDKVQAMTSDWIRKLFPLAAVAVLAPLPAAAQRADVCALVSCSASGQRAAVLDEPAPPRPGARTTAVARRPAQDDTTRDPWARRFQGRDNEDEDVCLLNFGIGGQLARKGSIDSHVLGRTQAWRAPARDGR
jgi:hypothetical protein